MYTELPKKRQGSALVLYLEGEAQDTAFEISKNDIANENSVDVKINHLNRLYMNDPTATKYQALEAFETFRRSCDISIQ